MQITLENLHNFVRDHGSVTFIDNKKQTRTLKDGSPDYWDLALKADEFRHAGKAYTRKQFEQYLDTVTVRRGNVTQIG